MIDLKKRLDDLAGPDHPFVKGAPVEGLIAALDKNGKDLGKTQGKRNERILKRFLNVNKN